MALSRDPVDDIDALLLRNRAWLGATNSDAFASYMMGDTPILLMAYGQAPTAERAERLAELIRGNLDHPARELMWGSPGTLAGGRSSCTSARATTPGRFVSPDGGAAVVAADVV